REQARESRHQSAGHGRAARGAGLRGWREDGDTEGRPHPRGVPAAARAVCGPQIRPQGDGMSELNEMKCLPCEGGVPPLTPAKAQELSTQLHADWDLTRDASS